MTVVRRDILKKTRLTEFELQETEEMIRAEVTEGYASVIKGYVGDDITGGGEDQLGVLDDIPTDASSVNKVEVGVRNHKLRYGTIDNSASSDEK